MELFYQNKKLGDIEDYHLVDLNGKKLHCFSSITKRHRIKDWNNTHFTYLDETVACCELEEYPIFCDSDDENELSGRDDFQTHDYERQRTSIEEENL